MLGVMSGQVRAELRLMGRAFGRAFGATVLAVGALYAVIVGLSEADPSAPSKLLLVPAAFLYGAFVGLWPALLVGGLRLSWVLVGAWTVVPLVLVPTAAALGLWAGGDLIAALAQEIPRAAAAASADHEWLVIGAGRLAHAGPIAIVVLLPLLLIDLGAIALSPGVLWALLLPAALTAGIVAVAVAPALLLSALVLLRAYVVRLRRRVAARREGRAEG